MRQIRKPLATASLMFLLATGSAAFAQLPPPPPMDDPAMASAPTTAVATGRIQRLLVNPGGDVDGLLLADGTQVSFPPQPANQLALKVGETVAVSGWRTPVAQVVRATGITAGRSGAQRLVTPMPGRDAPPPPPEPSAMAPLVAMNTSGNVARLLYTDRGDTNGVLLDNGTVVRFPPHIGMALQQTLQPGRPLFARGWGSRSAAGSAIEANALGSSEDRMQDVLAAGGPPGMPPPRPGFDGPRGPRGPLDRMPPPPPLGDMPPPPPAGEMPPPPPVR